MNSIRHPFSSAASAERGPLTFPRLLAPLGLLGLLVTALSACEPEERCSGGLIYLYGSCRPCPEEGHFDDDLGTCVCNEPEYYEYVPNKCELLDGAMPPSEDGPVVAETSAGCTDYCDFVDSCVAQNDTAAAAAPDVIAGLGIADDGAAACLSGCQADTGGAEDDPVTACVAEGRAEAACDGSDGLDGVIGSLGLLGTCCKATPDSPLCASICVTLTANDLVAGMVDFCD